MNWKNLVPVFVGLLLVLGTIGLAFYPGGDASALEVGVVKGKGVKRLRLDCLCTLTSKGKGCKSTKGKKKIQDAYSWIKGYSWKQLRSSTPSHSALPQAHGKSLLGQSCLGDTNCGKYLRCMPVMGRNVCAVVYDKSGLSCDVKHFIMCDKHYFCSPKTNTCLQEGDAKDGELCKSPRECINGACVRGKCASLGDVCEKEEKCSSGYVCNRVSSERKQCFLLGKAGELCGDGSLTVCSSRTRCLPKFAWRSGQHGYKYYRVSVCQLKVPRVLGEACGKTFPCKRPLVCVQGTGEFPTCHKVIVVPQKESRQPTSRPASKKQQSKTTSAKQISIGKLGEICWKRNCAEGLVCIVQSQGKPRCQKPETCKGAIKTLARLKKVMAIQISQATTTNDPVLRLGAKLTALELRRAYRRVLKRCQPSFSNCPVGDLVLRTE